MLPWILAASFCLIGLIPLLFWTAARWSKRRFQAEEQRAQAEFRLARERLEAKFFDLAARSGKPRGLRWVEVDFLDDQVCFARDRMNGMLAAFMGVNISFEAIEGGDMEDVAAVSNIRDAVALFHYDGQNWGTGGKALFNVNPRQALDRFHQQFAPLASLSLATERVSQAD
ncbi:MAG: hypothetical protein ACKO3P_16790 [Planctomycetaceae bacterium]